MAQFASDAFTGTAGDTLSVYSANWTRHSASASGVNAVISDVQRVRTSAAGAALYYHSGTPANANYTVTADAAFIQADGNASFSGVVGRLDTAANTYYMFRYIGSTTDGYQLYKLVAGTATQLGSTATAAVAAGTVKSIKLSMDSDQIKGFVDGVSTIAVTDTAITAAGKAGVRPATAGSDTEGIHLDNFSADDISSGVTAALTGQSIPASQGTLTPSVEVALTGQSVTAELGTVTVETGVTAALTGQSATVELGSVAPAVVSAITGQSVTAAQGTVAATVAHALTGQSASIALGGVSPAVVGAVTGQSITASQGTVEVDGGVVAALTGQGLILSSGSVLAEVGSAITGQSVTAELGSVAVYDGNVSMALTGQSVAVIGGSAHPVISAGITGQDIYFEQGSVSASVLVAAMLSAPRSIYSNTQTARRSNTQTARRPRA